MNPRFFVSARRMAVCLAMLLAMAGIASANPRPATVTMSNGKILKGNVSTTPGRLIRLYVGDKKVRKFALDAVGSIEFEAEVEKMQHKYLKGETGRGKDPILTLEEAYPLREFLVHANMLDGSKLSGAFGTAVFYVQSEGKTQKFVVKRKQTGNVGQKLEDLVYIKKIVFDDASASTPKDDGSPELDNQGRIAVRVPSAPEGAELYALSFDKLVRLKPTAADGAGQFKMDWPLGQSAWFALKAGNKITVGWPDGKTKPDEPDSDALFALTEKYLKDEPNFFTVRKVLAICRSPERRDMVYSLIILTRERKKQWAEKPWRLSIWKWKYDSDAQTMRLVEDGMFFRIGDTTKEAPPEVEISADLYNVEQGKSAWVVGNR